MGFFDFLTRRPQVAVRRTETVARPSTASAPVQRLDPVNPPFGEVEFVSKLYANRGRNPELGLAIASKVDAWRLLYQMGSPQAIHHDFRNHVINAESSDNFTKVMTYCIIQNVMFDNFSRADQVRNL